MANENAKIDEKKLLCSLRKVVNEEITLKESISLDEWLELKKAVYPINNYITKELTIKFIDKLQNIFRNTPGATISEADLEKLKEYYRKQNVNSNGYDFVAPVPSNNKKKELDESFPHITAEVKANIPYEKTKYGSSQKTGLEKDVRGLRDPKEKQKKKHDPTNDYKFLVVLDYKSGKYDSKKAVDDLIAYLDVRDVEKLEDLENPPQITKGKIYIVMLGLA